MKELSACHKANTSQNSFTSNNGAKAEIKKSTHQGHICIQKIFLQLIFILSRTIQTLKLEKLTFLKKKKKTLFCN